MSPWELLASKPNQPTQPQQPTQDNTWKRLIRPNATVAGTRG